ncbi:MAG: hypothetical protein GC156_11615 [Actinomycetales bacterium]|nr:hypothetical protein [Actinomycetales bacterium]
MIALAVVGGLTPTAAQADTYVDGREFGLHIPQIANGVVPSVTYGSVRIWDAGVSWGHVEKRRGRYWWTGLDRAVQAANAQNAQILYVLGSTPTWAASKRSQGTYPNRGAASMPRRLSDWRRWVTAVVTRYGASIDAYQIWNEANLATFWQGTPRQMARLTKEANDIIRRLDPTAQVVAASSTVRLRSAFARFFPAYLRELRRVGWPVDVFAIHTYGPSTSTPALRTTYVRLARRELLAARAPRSPLWDTEVNYGIKGPGPGYPDKDIGGNKAAIYVSQTYLDSVRLGVERTYWYSWSRKNDLLGITMYTGYPGATALQTTESWLSNAIVDCRSRHVRVCRINREGVRSRVAWTSSGRAGSFVVPYYATRMCDARGRCRPVAPGTKVLIGRMPRWFG